MTQNQDIRVLDPTFISFSRALATDLLNTIIKRFLHCKTGLGLFNEFRKLPEKKIISVAKSASFGVFIFIRIVI